MQVSNRRIATRVSKEITYRWKVTQGKNAQKTGLSAGSIPNDDQFPIETTINNIAHSASMQQT